MTDTDRADDTAHEDRCVRLSKEIAEEIIAVQARLLVLEKRPDDPAGRHEIALLARQLQVLELRKADCDRDLAELQRRIGAARDSPVLGDKPIDTLRRRTSERAAAQLPLWAESMRGVPNGILRSALFGAVRRVELQLEQRQLGELIGVPQSQISEWELGRRGLRIEHAIALAKALRTTVAHLAGEQPKAA